METSDELEVMKQMLIKADIVIMGSPVYFHNVSSQMKKIIDRLSYWTHYMKLIGKIGVTISTSASNGNEFVTNDLMKFMNYLGIVNMGSINFLNIKADQDYIWDAKTDLIVERIVAAYNVIDLEIDTLDLSLQEEIFMYFDNLYKSIKEGYEFKCWNDFRSEGSIFKEVFIHNFNDYEKI